MGLFNIFGKKDVSEDLSKKYPFKISVNFVPYKLNANSKSSVQAQIKVKNLLSEPALTSVVVEVPKQLGLEETCLLKEKEIRIGVIAPNEEKEVSCEIWSSNITEKGEYTITISAFAHYLNYAYVITGVKKRALLRVE
jgi:uncharacterized membrane protein